MSPPLVDTFRQRQILVVEDDAEQRTSLQQLIEERGYTVSVAGDGNEAIPLLHGREFELIILDIKMPYIDGFELLRFITSTFPKTRVIVLTAYADLASREKCRKLGAAEVISKPYVLGDLFDVIQQMLGESRI